MSIRKIYHLSHTDLDGFGCQALMLYLNSRITQFDIEFYNSNYGNEIMEKISIIYSSLCKLSKEELEETLVLITDLNLSDEQALFLDNIQKEKGFQLVLLDHHKSGINVSEKYDWYDLTEDKSGTLLTYEFIESEFLLKGQYSSLLDENLTEALEMISYGANCINTYDLWKKENEIDFIIGTNLTFYLNLVNSMFSRNEMEELHDEIVRRFLESSIVYLELKRDGEGVKNYDLEFVCGYLADILTNVITNKAKSDNDDIKNGTIAGAISTLKVIYYVELYKKDHYTISLVKELDNKVLVIYTRNSISSLILNGIVEKFNKENGTLAILSCNSSGIVSCRSIEDFDVSDFAKSQGGGGHLNASGFQIDINELKNNIESSSSDNKNSKDRILIKNIIGDISSRAIDFYSKKS